MSDAGPLPYLNRELSWLDFNARVLAEAFDERVPLLERLKFLAIFSTNLDEFYMVRVAGLRRRVAAGAAAERRIRCHRAISCRRSGCACVSCSPSGIGCCTTSCCRRSRYTACAWWG
jgi:hypothetical protein